MKSRKFFLACAAMVLIGCQHESFTNEVKDPTIESTQSELLDSKATPIQGRYIVTLKRGTFKNAINLREVSTDDKTRKQMYFEEIEKLKNELKNPTAKLKEENVSFGFDGKKILSVFRYGIHGFVADLTPSEVALLRRHPSVETISQDYMISLGKPTTSGNGTTTSGQEIPAGITRVGGPADGTGKTAWIVDTGIQLNHPDLNVSLGKSASFTGDYNPDDENGHGTHVAGIIAAKNNSIGVVGVAAGATLASVKVLGNNGIGDSYWIVQALDYISIMGKPGEVINMSLGSSTRYIDYELDNMIKYISELGLKVVIAAGNKADDASFYSPAHVDMPNVYTISAVEPTDFFTYFSNYGAPVDFAAPGYKIKSTFLGGGYTILSGTSMAAPHAAGVILLGTPTSNGSAKNGYWETSGTTYTGRVSQKNRYKSSVFVSDKDGSPDPIIHR